MTKAKQHYFIETLPQFIRNNPQRFWNFHTPPTTAPVLSLEGKKAKVINQFNDYFHSVFISDNGALSTLSSTMHPPIELLDRTDASILIFYSTLNTKNQTAPTISWMSSWNDMRNCAAIALESYAKKPLATAQLPDNRKIAKVVPIHKSSDYTQCNYRPIPLICTCCEIMKNIILKHLTSFLEN